VITVQDLRDNGRMLLLLLLLLIISHRQLYCAVFLIGRIMGLVRLLCTAFRPENKKRRQPKSVTVQTIPAAVCANFKLKSWGKNYG